MSWQVAYRGMVPDDVLDGLDVAHRLDGLRSFMESNPDFELLVACEDEGDVLGFIGIGLHETMISAGTPVRCTRSTYTLTGGVKASGEPC